MTGVQTCALPIWVAFPAEQADGILRMRVNGGWKLPEDSEWTWSAEKGFERKQPKAQIAQKGQPKAAAVRNK